MKDQVIFLSCFIVLLCFYYLLVEAETCKPNGKVRGMKSPPGHCVTEDVCCIPGRLYDTYGCSPPVSTNRTKATMMLYSFEKGGDGSPRSKCDNKYHSDDIPVVGMSTGWFANGTRCLKHITIHWKGNSVKAKVVDECDSSMGCDAKHDYLPPCDFNIINASMAVWKMLGVPLSQIGILDVFWSDA